MIQLDFDWAVGTFSRRTATVDAVGTLGFARAVRPVAPPYSPEFVAALPALGWRAFQLWVVIGQSQAVGYDEGQSPYGPRTAGLLEVRHSDQALIPYVAPGENDTSGTSLAETFGLTLARLGAPWRTPVMYNLAVPATGFHDGRWTVDGDLTVAVADAVETVLARYPQISLGGFLWHQGRRDRDHVDTYGPALDATIRRLQALGGGAVVPFVMGTLFQPFVDVDPGGAAVNQAILAAEDEAAGILVTDLSARTESHDGVHFSTEALLKVGRHYAARYLDWLSGHAETVLQPRRGGRPNRLLLL